MVTYTQKNQNTVTWHSYINVFTILNPFLKVLNFNNPSLKQPKISLQIKTKTILS